MSDAGDVLGEFALIFAGRYVDFAAALQTLTDSSVQLQVTCVSASATMAIS